MDIERETHRHTMKDVSDQINEDEKFPDDFLMTGLEESDEVRGLRFRRRRGDPVTGSGPIRRFKIVDGVEVEIKRVKKAPRLNKQK